MKKVTLFLLTLTVSISFSTAVNGFYNHNPHYHRQHRRRYPQHYQHRRNTYTNSNRRNTLSGQQEIVKDFSDRIELWVPCGRYCQYYRARLENSGYNQKSLVVQGLHDNKKSWEIPRNVDTTGITMSILRNVLKIVLPKISANYNYGNEYKRRRNSYNKKHKENSKRNDNMVDKNEKYNYYGSLQQRQEQGDELYHHSSNFNSGVKEVTKMYNNEKEVSKTRSVPEISQILKDPFYYANSNGIEIVDEDEEEFYAKDKRASIGFWDSRGKFQYY